MPDPGIRQGMNHSVDEFLKGWSRPTLRKRGERTVELRLSSFASTKGSMDSGISIFGFLKRFSSFSSSLPGMGAAEVQDVLNPTKRAIIRVKRSKRIGFMGSLRFLGFAFVDSFGRKSGNLDPVRAKTSMMQAVGGD
jgi:hypothetical protein